MKQKALSVVLRFILIPCAALILFLASLFAKELGTCYYVENPSGLICDLIVLAAFVPFMAALVEAWLIFTDIGRDRSFTAKNARRLLRISLYALIDTVLVIVFGVVWAVVDNEFGGPLLVCSVFVFLGIGAAVASAALGHLTRKAAEMQDENDLTI